ncbi:hypothetical protein CONLIGDRAFT_693476 [Coniochaeta ligniaria NRRL 30616]|uniref:Thioredoxin-like fold domain-containing protein n=1 Tax=Coniochaeta ligniaria NRRL 30616 TaxID=1408157 RepID=A0A1J7I877_9PEZI|nr:hypothetical protein CONLIGDRAFT_693476 [Coniochaeta ligniaria NRRL 30616]
MTEPRTRSWMPPIPAPLQRLFDHFPLTTYPPNELPARSPRPSSLPTLYVFASDEDAARGRPSFNPSCLKWQTFLRLSAIPHTLVPSTNHASPTGALPFLLPPTPTPSGSSLLPPRPIPASNLEHYILTTTTNPPSTSPPTTTSPDPQLLLAQQAPYLPLLTGPIRAAWLTALYLDPSNTPLLTSLYVSPATTSPLVRASLLSQLRSAAEAEVARILAPTTGHGGWKVSVNNLLEFGPGARTPAVIDREEVYARAAEAFESLAVLLREGEGGGTGWFFGRGEGGVFDAGVFAYTCLMGVKEGGDDGMGLGWGDGGRLDGIVRRAGGGELVRHRERVWEVCWGGDGDEKTEE